MAYECFKDKVALVTGGSRGIGLKISELLADSGCNLAIAYMRNVKAADEAKASLSKKGIKVHTIKANVAKEEAIDKIMEEISDNFGRLDYLVSNAAFGVLKPVGDFTAKRFDACMDANARAWLLLAQKGAEIMVPQDEIVEDFWNSPGGPVPENKRMVSLSSLGSFKVMPGYVGVGASKAAIETITRYLASEYGKRGIAVNTVSGGLVETDALKAFGDIDEWINNRVKITPLKRIGTPMDIAKAAVWLLSDQASWITGQTIIVDGGLDIA